MTTIKIDLMDYDNNWLSKVKPKSGRDFDRRRREIMAKSHHKHMLELARKRKRK